MPFAPITLDPCNSVAGATGTILRENITETLTQFDASTGKLNPLLAESWNAASPTVWTFKLRQGVKFHDGTDFNAENAIPSLRRDMDKHLNCINLVNNYLSTVVSIDAIDKNTLQFTTSTPTPTLPAQLAKEDIAAPSTPADKITDKPIGTGPYELVSYQPQNQVTVKAFGGYWGHKPTFDTVKYVFQADPSARAAMVTSGQAQFTIGLPTQFAKQAGAVTSPISQVLFLSIETAKVPLDDVRIRKAINYGIDRQGLIAAAYDGNGTPANQIIIKGVTGYVDGMEPWTYDVGKAKALVAEAAADRVPVDTEILIPTTLNYESSNGTTIAQFIQSNLSGIGLKAKVKVVDQVAWTELTQKPFGPPNREPSLLVYAHGNSTGDSALDFASYFASEGAQSHVNDPTLDKLIVQASAASGNERADLLKQANKRAMTVDVPMVPLINEVAVGMLSGGVKYNFPPNTGDEIHVNEMHF